MKNVGQRKVSVICQNSIKVNAHVGIIMKSFYMLLLLLLVYSGCFAYNELS